LKNLRAR